ncbi:MAG: phosphoribosylformylglycinamidine synthase subunit PurS [Proteobacteria bacterium]|nr:phosphoribosylformylglycinamidine synthase subunit PurS [Pseudomonadota bacterium]
MKARIDVILKDGVLDPQGKAIHQALRHLGFEKVREVRQGKVIEIDLDETDKNRALSGLKTMSEKLLANQVIENYRITLQD